MTIQSQIDHLTNTVLHNLELSFEAATTEEAIQFWEGEIERTEEHILELQKQLSNKNFVATA